MIAPLQHLRGALVRHPHLLVQMCGQRQGPPVPVARARLLVGLSDVRKVIVSVSSGHRESTESWSEVLRDLKKRGMCCPKLVIGDGHLGIWAGLRNIYPEPAEERCWNHKILNARDKVAKKQQAAANLLLRQIPYAETRAEAEFQLWCRQRGYKDATAVLDRDWERMITFYNFPKTHWQHIRTSNPVESPFSALRLPPESIYTPIDGTSCFTGLIQ